MSTEITDAELAELRRLHEAATPGPLRLEFEAPEFMPPYWSAVGPDGARRSVFYDRQNAEFHVAARNALPALLSRLERAEKDANDSEKALDEHNEASADALELLWQHVIIARKPDYGPWEYPGQAFRHLRDEFNDMAARVATLEAIVEKCQWASAPFRDEALCPCCGGRQPLAGDTVGKNGFGHSDDCEIASALRGLEGK